MRYMMKRKLLGLGTLVLLVLAAVPASGIALADAPGPFSATAQIVQRDPGVVTFIDCGSGPRSGVTITGEIFRGAFGVFSGSGAADVIQGSQVSAAQSAILCFTAGPDPSGNVPFLGTVGGTATITKGNAGANGTLVAGYGAYMSGTLNVSTGGLSAEWVPNTGGWFTRSATGDYAGLAGASGPASATAAAAVGPSPEVGSLTISSL